ncbi:MAG: capsular polysaccharide export protein, LipB/KpsS family [Thermoleophilia bacterium]
MKRVIYQIFDQAALHDLWMDAAQTLAAEDGWEPVYWVALGEMCQEARNRFPSAVVHDKVDAMRGRPPSDPVRVQVAALDIPILEQYARYERVFMSMADRADGPAPISFRERRRVFRRQLTYWLGAFDRLRPDLVVFQSSPHCLFDYVLYAVAIESGVDVRLFAQTSLLGYTLVKRSIEEVPAVLSDAFSRLMAELTSSEFSLHPDVARYLEVMQGSYAGATPWYMVAGAGDRASVAAAGRRALWHPARVIKGLGRPHKWPVYSHNVATMVAGRIKARPAPADTLVDSRGLVLNGRTGRFEKTEMTFSEWTQWESDVRLRRAELEEQYRALSGFVDLARPYVYLPLHYQPERTTCPEAGLFDDQLLVASLIARSLPPGWSLYVREHPSQFRDRPFYGEQGRDKGLYEDLRDLPATWLVAFDMDAFKLIDEAQAVATATGTAGWEAVVRGVPCLLFGHAWYRGCPGVRFIQSQSDVARGARRCRGGRGSRCRSCGGFRDGRDPGWRLGRHQLHATQRRPTDSREPGCRHRTRASEQLRSYPMSPDRDVRSGTGVSRR